MNREIFVFYLSKDSTGVAATIEALKGCLSFSLPLKPQAAGRRGGGGHVMRWKFFTKDDPWQAMTTPDFII